MNLELKKAIDQISKDKGLERDMLIDTLEDAVRTSVIRKYGEDLDVEVRYNDDTGDIEVYQFKVRRGRCRQRTDPDRSGRSPASMTLPFSLMMKWGSV